MSYAHVCIVCNAFLLLTPLSYASPGHTYVDSPRSRLMKYPVLVKEIKRLVRVVGFLISNSSLLMYVLTHASSVIVFHFL